jgi:hypothetical protein
MWTPSEKECKQNTCLAGRLRFFKLTKNIVLCFLTNACPDILCAYLDELLLGVLGIVVGVSCDRILFRRLGNKECNVEPQWGARPNWGLGP